MESDDVFEYVSDLPEESLDEEQSVPPPVEPVYAPNLSTADLIAIYKLQKAGFVSSDFE